MKKIGILLAVALGLCIEPGDPTELQIRTAFEQALNNPLRPVLIADEAGGSGRVLRGGATEIRALRKLGCVAAPVSAYVCDFFVELRADGETVRRTISGYFLDGPGTLTFAREVYAGAPPPVRLSGGGTSG